MFLTFKLISCFLQDVSWISMDAVCHTIQDFITVEEDEKDLPELVNIVHPCPVTWHDVMLHISNSLRSETGSRLPYIPFDEWMVRLEPT